MKSYLGEIISMRKIAFLLALSMVAGFVTDVFAVRYETRSLEDGGMEIRSYDEPSDKLDRDMEEWRRHGWTP